MKLILLIIGLGLLMSTASATDYYIRSDGNDSCTCTHNYSYVENNTHCACLTPLAGNAKLTSAGDTLNIYSGTYNTEGIPAVSVGNATHRITYQGYGATAPLFVGNYSLIYSNGIGLGSGDNYITIANLNFSNYTNSDASAGYCVLVDGVHDIIITNVTGIKCGYAGMQISGGSHNISVSDTTMRCSGMANFRTSGLTTHNITFDNIKTNNTDMSGTSWSTDYDIAFTKGSYDIWLNNTFIDCQHFKTLGRGVGITGSNTQERNHHIYINNFTSNNLNHGIFIRGSSHHIWVDGFYFLGGNGVPFQLHTEDGSNNSFIYVDNVEIECGGQGGDKGGFELTTGSNNITIDNASVVNCSEYAGTCGAYVLGNDITITNSIFSNNSYGVLLSGYRNSVLSSVCYGNIYGIKSTYLSAGSPGTNTIKNSIFEDNNYNFYNASVEYSFRGSYNTAENNTIAKFENCILGDPLFVNNISHPYDFHLKSQYSRWNGTAWVNDASTSTAIAAGDPTSDNSLSPWGGVIEMGIYGNTAEASKSSWVAEQGHIYVGHEVEINSTGYTTQKGSPDSLSTDLYGIFWVS